VLLVASALIVLVAMALASPSFRVFLHGIRFVFSQLWTTVQSWF